MNSTRIVRLANLGMTDDAIATLLGIDVRDLRGRCAGELEDGRKAFADAILAACRGERKAAGRQNIAEPAAAQLHRVAAVAEDLLRTT